MATLNCNILAPEFAFMLPRRVHAAAIYGLPPPLKLRRVIRRDPHGGSSLGEQVRVEG